MSVLKTIGRYFFNTLVGLDQFGNTLWGGCADETVSSRLGRIKLSHGGKIPWYRPLPKLIDVGLNIIQKNHSVRSIEYDEYGEIINQSVFDNNELPPPPQKGE